MFKISFVKSCFTKAGLILVALGNFGAVVHLHCGVVMVGVFWIGAPLTTNAILSKVARYHLDSYAKLYS